MNVEGLHQLAGSLRGRNAIDAEIARLIDRPALPGHLGEWIASQIFDIELANSAVTKGIDGAFRQAPQPGATVNVKLYGTRSGFVDLIEEASADYYLVLTGPIAQAASSRGMHRPVCIRGVYLFETRELISDLRARGNRIGVASSVRKPLWEAAELYPNPTNPALVLSDAQRYALALFRDPSDEHQLSNRPAQSRPRTLPRRLVTPSRSSIGERRRTGVEAFRVALESRGFAVDEPTPGRSIVFCAHRRGRMIEVHFRSSTGVGPAYWPKSTLEPAPTATADSPCFKQTCRLSCSSFPRWSGGDRTECWSTGPTSKQRASRNGASTFQAPSPRSTYTHSTERWPSREVQ